MKAEIEVLRRRVEEQKLRAEMEALQAEAPRLFHGANLPPTQRLWAEACMYASDVINMTARVGDKPDMLSPRRKVHGRAPFARLLPFLKLSLIHI